MKPRKFSCFVFSCFLLHCSGYLLSALGAPNKQRTNHLMASRDNGEMAGNMTTLDEAFSLQQQAQVLREEALAMRETLEESKNDQIVKENTKVDKWIDELFIQCQVDENTQIINNVDQIFKRLMDDRYSQEQVNRIFNRICETGPPQSRSNCSPLMESFVEAVGKLDAVDREKNPNKRWSGKVERKLRKRLFAMDWGMDIEENDEEDNPWRINGR